MKAPVSLTTQLLIDLLIDTVLDDIIPVYPVKVGMLCSYTIFIVKLIQLSSIWIVGRQYFQFNRYSVVVVGVHGLLGTVGQIHGPKSQFVTSLIQTVH